MGRLQECGAGMIDQLLEKYLNSFKGDRSIYDVFVNPSKSDIREVEQQGDDIGMKGFRFIIDFQKKDVYVWSNKIIHQYIMRDFRQYWNKLDHTDYLDKGKETDRYFTGHVEGGYVLSDIWRGFEWRFERSNQQLPIDNFKKMQAYDKSWLNRYGINGKEVQKLTDNVIKAYEYRENNK